MSMKLPTYFSLKLPFKLIGNQALYSSFLASTLATATPTALARLDVLNVQASIKLIYVLEVLNKIQSTAIVVAATLLTTVVVLILPKPLVLNKQKFLSQTLHLL